MPRASRASGYILVDTTSIVIWPLVLVCRPMILALGTVDLALTVSLHTQSKHCGVARHASEPYVKSSAVVFAVVPLCLLCRPEIKAISNGPMLVHWRTGWTAICSGFTGMWFMLVVLLTFVQETSHDYHFAARYK